MRELFRLPSYPVVWVVGFFQSMGFFLLINVPGRFLELGLTEGTIGLSYALAALAGLAFRPLLGRALDVVRRRTVMRVAGITHAAAVIGLAGTAVVGPPLFGFFVLARASQIAILTATMTYLADVLPAHVRTRGIAVFGLSGVLPIGLSTILGDGIIGAAGYTAAIATSAALAFVAAVLVFWLPALPVMGQRARRSFWAALAEPELRLVWLVTLVFSMGIESLFAFMRTFVDTHPDAGSLGLFFGVYGALAVAIRLFGGRWFEILPPATTASVGSLALAGGMLLLAFAEGPVLFVTAAMLAGSAHAVTFPVLNSLVVARARTSERGSALATFTSIFDLAILGLVPVVGLLIDASGYRLAFSVVAFTMLVGAAVHHVAGGRRSERPTAAVR